MLKTLINSSVFRTVFPIASLVCQPQLCTVAGEVAESGSTPNNSFPLVKAGDEKISDGFDRAVKKVRASLVRIEPCLGNTGLNTSFAIPFELGGAADLTISKAQADTDPFTNDHLTFDHGAGVIVSEDGVIWTSSAVVGDAQSVKVILATGESYPANILKVDYGSGLAVLKIAATHLVPIELAENLGRGTTEWAMSVSLSSENYPSLSKGLIWLDFHSTSSLGTRVGFFSYKFPVADVEAGSALINMSGQLLGIDVPPPLPLTNDSGTRYGLTSDSAVGIQRALANETISPENSFAVESTAVSANNDAQHFDAVKAAFDTSSSRRNHEMKKTTAARMIFRPTYSANWFGAPIQDWIDWLNEMLSPALPQGGIH